MAPSRHQEGATNREAAKGAAKPKKSAARTAAPRKGARGAGLSNDVRRNAWQIGRRLLQVER